VLLYWDEVGTIVPYEFIENPALLGEHTRSLIEAQLVRQVIPSVYLDRVRYFADAFLGYVATLGPVLDQRRVAFNEGKTFRVHVEKMENIGEDLGRIGLARRSETWAWYDVERDTAHDFMAYLAIVLGQLDDLQFAPISDKSDSLRRLSAVGGQRTSTLSRVEGLRLEILQEALPAPSTPLNAPEIQVFKKKYGSELRRFRRYIESELTVVADIRDEALRERRLQLFKDEIRDETSCIKQQMEAHGWIGSAVRKLSTLLASAPVIGTWAGLLGAVVNAFEGSRIQPNQSPLAYAVHAEERLARS
jgi:hypothetical protein